MAATGRPCVQLGGRGGTACARVLRQEHARMLERQEALEGGRAECQGPAGADGTRLFLGDPDMELVQGWG